MLSPFRAVSSALQFGLFRCATESDAARPRRTILTEKRAHAQELERPGGSRGARDGANQESERNARSATVRGNCTTAACNSGPAGHAADAPVPGPRGQTPRKVDTPVKPKAPEPEPDADEDELEDEVRSVSRTARPEFEARDSAYQPQPPHAAA